MTTTKTAVTVVPTITQSDVLSAVTVFVAEKNRPCPALYLTEKFGDEVQPVIDELKASGILLGLRGRNGGLALHGSDIVAKRAEHGIKKAAKLAEKASEAVETDEAAEAV